MDDTIKKLVGEQNILEIWGISNRYFKFKCILPAFFSVIFIFLAFFFIWSIIVTIIILSNVIALFLKKKYTKYVLTEQKILIHQGVISQQTTSIDLSKINDISVEQNFSERIFYKTGKVSIHTADTIQKDKALQFIDSPYDVKAKIEKAISNLQKK